MKSFESSVNCEITRLLVHKKAPGHRVLQPNLQKDYWLGIYENFGELIFRSELREDLLTYLESEDSCSFWAVYKDVKNFAADDFESRMNAELSSLQLRSRDYFVVGLHPESLRESRRFPWPTLVFNRLNGAENPMVQIYSDVWQSHFNKQA